MHKRSFPDVVVLLLVSGAVGIVGAFGVAGADAADLRIYQTRYYDLHTDLPPAAVQEATQRLNAMAEEYYRRTSDFARNVQQRLPVFIFQNLRDYYAQGGMPGSIGLFSGDRLMLAVGPNPGSAWETLQHEGFHQFAFAAIGRELPIWANEGMAVYFELGEFTGDGFATGLIPPARLKAMQQGLRENKFRPLAEMMQLAHESWNAEVQLVHSQAGMNYLQAWSMVHFLAHGDDGRYQRAFGSFLGTVSRGQPWEQAWMRSFGADVQSFEQRWREWWLNLPEHPTADLYAQATLATLASYFARAFSQRQYFEEFEEFVAAAEKGQLKSHPEDALPPGLLKDALARVKQQGQWSLERRPGRRLVVCELDNGQRLEGNFKVQRGRVDRVWVQVKAPRKGRR